jgi:hypothetical protein
MTEATGNSGGRKIGRALATAAAALVLGTITFLPGVANARGGGGGGGGGGFHGGGGGFHGGGFHGGGFHGGFAGFHGGGFHNGFGRFRGGFGVGGLYAPFWWGYGYPYYDYGYYPDYGYYGYDPSSSYYGNYPGNGYGAQPYTGATWYYCSNPAGYYPYVSQCNTGWQAVPAS